MPRFLLFLLSFCLLISIFPAAAQELPNREFRGVWVATVANLDWPVQGASPEKQKAALRDMLDKIKEANLNAVFFQVRTECDAFYRSSKEPWSRFLTGTQGKDPGFDPLALAIEEAHARGLELHAWFNPYRVNTVNTPGTYHAQHISKTKPEWLLTFANGKKILNPGLPEVRQYIASIIREVAQNYAIDGVHFDDYFYPYPEGTFTGISSEDAQTFTDHGTGFPEVKDWRRYNVNETMRLVHTALQEVRPEARFGVSPFGIWKNGEPAGITGMDSYNAIYADPLHWLEQKYVDYLTPQLYWAIGGKQDYRKLLYWWSDKAFEANRHLYAGHMVQKNYTIEELPHQIEITRSNRERHALGSVVFRASNITNNTLHTGTSFKSATFRFPAAPPAMAWKTGKEPSAPQGLTVTLNEQTGNYEVSWTRSPANTHSFKRYLLYTANNMPATGALTPDGAVRAFTTQEKVTIAASDVPSPTSFWAVTELSPGNQESPLSNVVILGGTMPVLAENSQKPVLTVEELAKENPPGAGPTSITSAGPFTTSTKNLLVAIELKKKSGVKAELHTLDRKKKTRVFKEKYKPGKHTLAIPRGKFKPGTYLLVLEYGDERTVRKVVFN
ncbi:glycoside hydrolase family 10 protein [Rufibacter radiotolerans]|uniref:glycoside hydrolase family 10 protein n=1 Tax=Rufibacter radiotolerans TaxID=1379910 RepID=UPI000664724E|nr:family 10 glycosylhydrolase [Rufibacter radiotolerans]